MGQNKHPRNHSFIFVPPLNRHNTKKNYHNKIRLSQRNPCKIKVFLGCPYYTAISLQYIKELRKFIQAPVTDEVSDTFFDCAVRELLAADDSRVKVELEHHAVLHTVFFHEFGFAFFGIHVHTSELIHLEHLSVLSDTGLLEEDCPGDWM